MFFSFFFLMQYIYIKLAASELKKRQAEMCSFFIQSFTVLSHFSTLHSASYQKSPGGKVCLPERTEHLLKQCVACGLSSSLQGKGWGRGRGLGNVAEKWVRKASLEAKVLGNWMSKPNQVFLP